MFLRNILSIFVEYLGFNGEYLWITQKESWLGSHYLFEPHLVAPMRHQMTFTIWELKEHKDILTSLYLGGQMVITHEIGFAESMGGGKYLWITCWRIFYGYSKRKVGWVVIIYC
jgi:hypothetical protein